MYVILRIVFNVIAVYKNCVCSRNETQRNGLLVTDGGGIRGVLTTMALHSGRREVVKSGCHTLAILSDIQGQGARIAGADGVKVMVCCLSVIDKFSCLRTRVLSNCQYSFSLSLPL